MTEAEVRRCSWVGCSHPPSTSLEARPLCIAHFLDAAKRRLGLIEMAVSNQPGARDLSSDVQSVLSQMISQMSTLAAGARRLHPELREKFISLSETAAKLYKQSLRPPRFGRSVTCRIHISAVSAEVPQSCSTVNVSQRGACIEIGQPFQVKQVITLEGVDTGKRARAKVVWIKKKNTKTFTVGLEILDQDDFWGVGHLAESLAHPPKTCNGIGSKQGSKMNDDQNTETTALFANASTGYFALKTRSRRSDL